MRAMNFKVVSRLVGSVAVISPQGYLNNIAGESLVQECNSCLGNGIKKIVLNFSETDLINSIGISLLLAVIERLKDSDGTLCFTNMSKMHNDTFEMLGLTKYIMVFGNEDEALAHLNTGMQA